MRHLHAGLGRALWIAASIVALEVVAPPRVAHAASVVVMPGCGGGTADVKVSLSTGRAAVGGADPHWELIGIAGNPNVTPSSPAPASVIGTFSTWQPAAGPTAKWISHTSNAAGQATSTSSGAGTYTYRLRFTIPVGFSSVLFTGRIAGDNDAKLYLNGSTSPFAVSAAFPNGHTGYRAFGYSGPFLTGANEIVAVVTNQGGPGGKPTPTGLFVDGFLLGNCHPKAGCVLAPPGLVAWYALDDDDTAGVFADLAGGDNPAALPSGRPSAGFPSYIGRARMFGGTQEFAVVADHAALNFGSGGFTICVWASLKDLNPDLPSLRKAIVDKCQVGGNGAVTAGFVFGFEGGNLFLERNGAHYVSTGPALKEADSWHFVAVVAAPGSPGTVTFFVDGIAQAPIAGVPATSVSTPTVPLYVGKTRLSNTGGNYRLDELQIFNRAVTNVEVLSIHAAGKFGICRPPTSDAAEPHAPGK